MTLTSHSAIRISIIIPTLNSPTIGQTLDALRAQTIDLAGVEVLVVGIDSAQQVTNDPLVRFIDTGRPTSAAYNRNLGISHSRGEILCFTDSDCIPVPDWLERLNMQFQRPEVSIVGGGVEFAYGNYWAYCDNLSWFFKFLSSADAGTRDHLPSLNLSLRRAVVERVGAMDLSFPLAAGEDTEWTRRMRSHGYLLQFAPDAKVVHLARRGSLRQLWSHAYAYGRYTSKIKGAIHNSQTEMEDRFLPRSGWLLLLLTPILATLATLRVLYPQFSLRALGAFPGIWISKIAWCIGAWKALQSSKQHELMNNGNT